MTSIAGKVFDTEGQIIITTSDEKMVIANSIQDAIDYVINKITKIDNEFMLCGYIHTSPNKFSMLGIKSQFNHYCISYSLTSQVRRWYMYEQVCNW